MITGWILALSLSVPQYPTISDTTMSLRANGGWGNTHEKTHGVNSELRNKHGGDCFYLMWGRCVKFKRLHRPTIAEVSRKVKLRGGVAWYLTGSPAWNDQPLYLFDELTSYANGTVDAWNNKAGDNSATLQYAVEFQHYCAVLVLAIPDTYEDKREVARFWIWNYDRLRIVMDYYRTEPIKAFRMAGAQWTEQIETDRSAILLWLSQQ